MIEIQHGPYQGELCSAKKPRGRRARYPLRAMQIGDYILVPREEETLLRQSARNAKQNHRIQMQVAMTADGRFWHALRTK